MARIHSWINTADENDTSYRDALEEMAVFEELNAIHGQDHSPFVEDDED